MLNRLAKNLVEAARQHVAAEAARKALEAQNEADTVAAAIGGAGSCLAGNLLIRGALSSG